MHNRKIKSVCISEYGLSPNKHWSYSAPGFLVRFLRSLLRWELWQTIDEAPDSCQCILNHPSSQLLFWLYHFGLLKRLSFSSTATFPHVAHLLLAYLGTSLATMRSLWQGLTHFCGVKCITEMYPGQYQTGIRDTRTRGISLPSTPPIRHRRATYTYVRGVGY